MPPTIIVQPRQGRVTVVTVGMQGPPGPPGQPGPVGASDHGLLTGLSDDDHPQYAKIAGYGNLETYLPVWDNVEKLAKSDLRIFAAIPYFKLSRVALQDYNNLELKSLNVYASNYFTNQTIHAQNGFSPIQVPQDEAVGYAYSIIYDGREFGAVFDDLYATANYLNANDRNQFELYVLLSGVPAELAGQIKIKIYRTLNYAADWQYLETVDYAVNAGSGYFEYVDDYSIIGTPVPTPAFFDGKGKLSVNGTVEIAGNLYINGSAPLNLANVSTNFLPRSNGSTLINSALKEESFGLVSTKGLQISGAPNPTFVLLGTAEALSPASASAINGSYAVSPVVNALAADFSSFRFNLFKSNSASVRGLRGAHISIFHSGGNVATDISAVFIDNTITAGAANVYSVRTATNFNLAAGINIGSVFGALINTGTTIGTGSITNRYQLYLTSPTQFAANEYGIWQNESFVKNYFRGSFEIDNTVIIRPYGGTDTASSPVHIIGRLNTNTFVLGLIQSQLIINPSTANGGGYAGRFFASYESASSGNIVGGMSFSAQVGGSATNVNLVIGFGTLTANTVAANVATMVGGDISTNNNNSGTITDVIGLRVRASGNAGGNITNRYGLWIQIPAGKFATNDYGIFQESGLTKNVFHGSLHLDNSVDNPDINKVLQTFKAAENQSADIWQYKTSAESVLAALTASGAFKIAGIPDAAAPNGSIFYSTDQNKFCGKDLSGTIHPFH